MDAKSLSPDAMHETPWWRIGGTLLVGLFVAYLDRTNLSVSIQAVSRDLGFAGDAFAVTSSWALTIFLIGYAVANILGGFLTRRMDPKPVVIACFLTWSLATVVVGLTASLGVLLACRFILDVAERIYWPQQSRFARLSTRHDRSEATDGLGQHYELALNTYKPFACGIVSHPAIDAAIQLRNANGLQPDAIRTIDLRVHRLVLNLMDKTEPRAGLEGKFSIYHAVAVAVVTGRAGEQAFTDRAVADPAVVAVRRWVTATTDPAIKADQVDMTIALTDGRKLHKSIEHAVGSQDRPMTDAQLEDKFADLAAMLFTL